jgi:hypothetical protein
MGFRGFSLRGKEKVSSEWTLVCLAYNLRRLHRMMGGANNGASRQKPPSMGGSLIRNLPVGEWIGRLIHAISRRLPTLAAVSTPELALTPTNS